jgi:hypothetical protein
MRPLVDNRWSEDPTAYHLYRLEQLFLSLQELWARRCAGLDVGTRWISALPGYAALRNLTDLPDTFPVTLEVGTRFCNSATETLTAAGGDPAVRDALIEMEEVLARVRQITGSKRSGRLAHQHLAALLGLPSETAADTLIGVAFARGARVARGAFGHRLGDGLA